MGNLYIGSTQIAIKSARRQVENNLKDLRAKQAQVKPETYAGTHIISFYEEKITSQQITLGWLQKAL